jgi:hypothetical protein
MAMVDNGQGQTRRWRAIHMMAASEMSLEIGKLNRALVKLVRMEGL